MRFDRNKLIAAKVPTMYSSFTDDDWETIISLEESVAARVFMRMQEEVYEYYVNKLINEACRGAVFNEFINAVGLGGILEGIKCVQLSHLIQKAHNKRKNRKGKNNTNK